MARTLHLLVCISAAMTASGGYKYPFSFDTYRSETMDYPTHDRMNVRSADQSSMVDSGDQVRRSYSGTYKIMNRVPKPVAMSRKRAGGADDRVLFPGPTSRHDEIQAIPEECLKHKLCDNLPDYPADIADEIIANLGDKIKYLSMDQLDASDTPEITQRIGSSDDNLDLCDSQPQIKYPEGGFDKDNNFHRVLNNKSNPIQGVRVEICQNTDSPCKSFVCFERNYEARCIQKYTYRPMLTIDNVTKTEREVQIAVPSCCACVAKLTYV